MLARVYDERHADLLTGKLAGTPVRTLLRAERTEPPVVARQGHRGGDRGGDGPTAQPAGRRGGRRAGFVGVDHGRPAARAAAAVTAVLATAVFVVTYVLIATERVHRVAAALGGAAAMVLIGVVDAESAFFARETGDRLERHLPAARHDDPRRRPPADRRCSSTWRSGRRSGPAAGRSGSWPRWCVITAVASALLDNVTTVLLVAPVTVLVCERLGLPPGPVPDRRGARLQHRRHRDADRRPAEHHHRQPGRPVLQRLPGQPGAARARADRGLRWAVPGALPVRVHATTRTGSPR